MLGISGYKLNYIDKLEDFRNTSESKSLKEIIGKSIESYFVQWNSLSDKDWNEDGPIILNIANNQIEFTAYQLEYSLTFNTINLNNELNWYGAGDEMPLIWKRDPFDEINSILYRRITKVFILEYALNPNFGIVGFELEFSGIDTCLHLSNGLDCNVIKFHKTQVDERNRRTEL